MKRPRRWVAGWGALLLIAATCFQVSAALYSLEESVIDVGGIAGASMHYSNFGSLGPQFGTNSASSDFTLVVGFARSTNEAPEVAVSYFDRVPGQPLSISISALLAKAVDLEGSPVQYLATAPTSQQGVPILQQAQNIVYSSTSLRPGADRFSYTIYDGTGLVTEAVVLVNTGGAILTVLDPSAVFWLRFAGPPLQAYTIEATDRLAPADWQSKGTVSIDSFGNALFKDATAVGRQYRYYRAVLR